MSAVHEEYGRFMQWLRAADAAEDTRRIAKIVQDNLDGLIPTVNNAGQRAAYLTPLLRNNLAATTDVIEATEDDGRAAPLPWTRLKKLAVGPFRGFRREEQFDLSNNIVLFLGPNGSGKSSLCEAIEFALLGYVEEATAKRIDDINAYFDNIHEREHVAPRLWSMGADDGVPIIPNAELLRFSIIEKNRIEGFARLASRTPAQAGVLIASLFGLDGFNSFVGNFTQTLDTQLRLTTPNQDTLNQKRAALEVARLRVAGDAAAQLAFDEQQETIAAGYEDGLTYAQLLERLGMHGQEGRLQQINAALQEQIPLESNVAAEGLTLLRKSLRDRLLELAKCEAALTERAEQVSFLALYRAMHALRNDPAEACPACETPLVSVTTNPFQRAEQGLERLRDLAELEQEKERLTDAAKTLSTMIRTRLKLAHSIQPYVSQELVQWVPWLEQEEETPLWTTGLLTVAGWHAVLRNARLLEKRDARIRAQVADHDLMVNEAAALEVRKTSVDELRGRRELHNEQVAAEHARIDGFDADNIVLIEGVAGEAIVHQQERRIQAGYETYLDSIKTYRDGLPAGLLADLNDTTKDLYNRFNGDDHPNDLLTELTLPMRGGERIQVAFAALPEERHDALATLSEGHLRCLGLAILLAKNIKLGLPLLVFDDAVNAIDHDHRKGIRDTLFGDDRLRAKQMIITCHSPEFITQVQNGLEQNESKLYILKHHAGDHQPIVRGGSDRHYLRRAQERLEDGDERQALASSRQALENLTGRVWKAVANKDEDLAKVSLVFRGPNSEPELRNLILQLAAGVTEGITQGRLTGPKWLARQEAFQELIDVPEATLAWRYLNKGTHAGDGEDFEVGIVRQIVNALAKLSGSF